MKNNIKKLYYFLWRTLQCNGKTKAYKILCNDKKVSIQICLIETPKKLTNCSKSQNYEFMNKLV